MSINSKKKGARAELEFSHLLTDMFGLKARRGQQYSGSPDSPDVVFHEDFHFEVKRVEALNHEKAIQQAIRDAGPDKIPLMASRKNRSEWMVSMRAQDMIRFAKSITDLLEKNHLEINPADTSPAILPK